MTRRPQPYRLADARRSRNRSWGPLGVLLVAVGLWTGIVVVTWGLMVLLR